MEIKRKHAEVARKKVTTDSPGDDGNNKPEGCVPTPPRDKHDFD